MREGDSDRRRTDPSSTSSRQKLDGKASNKAMGGPRKKNKRDRDAHASVQESAQEGDGARAPQAKTVSHIRNKMVRSQQYHKLKHERN